MLKGKTRGTIGTKRKVFGCIGVLLILALCAFVVLSLTTGMRNGPKVLTYAEVNPLDGTIVGEMSKAFKSKAEEVSGGKLLIDLQPGGVLGSEDQILDICWEEAISATSPASPLSP